MAKRGIVIIDNQVDALDPSSELYVPNANVIIKETNQYLRKLRPTDVAFVLATQDWSCNRVEIRHDCKPKSQIIVDLCCVPRPIPLFEFHKNVANIWDAHTLPVFGRDTFTRLLIANENITTSLETFFEHWHNKGITNIEIMGVEPIRRNLAVQGLLVRKFNIFMQQTLVHSPV